VIFNCRFGRCLYRVLTQAIKILRTTSCPVVHTDSQEVDVGGNLERMEKWYSPLRFLNRSLWYTYVRTRCTLFSVMIQFNYIVFDMFRTAKSSSSGSLCKQLYGILSCICISRLVADWMCLISNTSCQRHILSIQNYILKKGCRLLVRHVDTERNIVIK